jgi:hypothetical protein
MGMFDDLSDTLMKAGTDAANFAKDTASTAKLNLDLKGKENALKKAYAELGMKYYDQHKAEGDPQFAKIHELIVDIIILVICISFTVFVRDCTLTD